jgi:dipeptidyl aminopeptidase/acylaminoacyl peptidase
MIEWRRRLMSGVPLIPRAALFGNPSRYQARVSPDGQWLTWLAPFEGVLNVWLAPADDIGAAAPLTRRAGRPIAWQDWAFDGEHVLFMTDENGDENYHLFAVERACAEVRDLTPIAGVSARMLMWSPERPRTVLVGLNDRDKKWHDVWTVDLASGERELALENGQQFWSFTFDWQLNPRLARKAEPEHGGSRLYRLIGGRAEPWLRIPHADEMTTWPLMFNRSGDAWMMMSSLDRSRAALVRVEDASGAQTVLAEHDKVDLGGARIWNPVTLEIDAVAASYLRQEWIALNPAVATNLRFLCDNLGGAEFFVDSQSDDNDRWVVTAYGPKQPLSYFLYDRRRGVLGSLFSARPELAGYRLAPMQSHVIKARDGLDLVSYLTLPADVHAPRPAAPLPMVLVVHGGPWGRDGYGYRADHQWLANRGYAVLSVNYRASTGFGKDFVNAGRREHAGKMHDDLIDAVEWAVREGIARRDKVAITGISYGGYATLVGLTFTPELFCCGVSIVGISNLVTMLENMPPYWAGFDEFMFHSYADVRSEEGRAWLRSRSPLYKVERICRPLLIGHGANDVRCKLQESDQIVRAMRERGLPVTYIVYPDEGHGFARPENRTAFNAITEAFFAEHLGGRCEPIGNDLVGSSLQVLEGIDAIAGLAQAVESTEQDVALARQAG